MIQASVFPAAETNTVVSHWLEQALNGSIGQELTPVFSAAETKS
jgi:hypothetical protein